MVQGRSTGIELAYSHHVARYCRRRRLRSDGRPLRDAFLLRFGEEYLSTNWMEYFRDSERLAQIAGVLQSLVDKGFRASRTASFAVLNVGAAITTCKNDSDLDIQIIALGETHDPSHAGIFGYTEHNTDAAATLARQVREVYPAAIFVQ